MTPPPIPSNPQVGDVLAGKYRIERLLGSGGMGMVVEATHLVLEERVALKFLLPRVLDSPEATARFLREARVAARLNSPHLARVRDVGELDGGVPYIVMDLLVGESLDVLLEREQRLAPARACDVLLQACEALATAHAAGVVHRDLKPGNLFLTRAEDGGLLVKVLDFGISKITVPGAEPSSSLTQTQVSMGSPLYMAPEQMRSARSVDHRADVWALGVVLYHCLTGQNPFDGDALPMICAQVLEAEYTPLLERAPELPAALGEIVDRCLRRDPEERYPDVVALADALAPHAGEEGPSRAARCRRVLAAASLPPGNATQSSEVLREPSAAATGTSFAGTRPRSVYPRASGRALAVAASVVVVVGLGLVTWLATRGAPPVAVAPPASAPVPAPRAARVAAAPIEPAPAASLSAPATAPSASAVPARVPARPAPPAPARPTVVRPPVSRAAPPTAPPTSDPFADRK